jgi:hypothetical protein
LEDPDRLIFRKETTAASRIAGGLCAARPLSQKFSNIMNDCHNPQARTPEQYGGDEGFRL